jgi:hypothetical protein
LPDALHRDRFSEEELTREQRSIESLMKKNRGLNERY